MTHELFMLNWGKTGLLNAVRLHNWTLPEEGNLLTMEATKPVPQETTTSFTMTSETETALTVYHEGGGHTLSFTNKGTEVSIVLTPDDMHDLRTILDRALADTPWRQPRLFSGIEPYIASVMAKTLSPLPRIRPQVAADLASGRGEDSEEGVGAETGLETQPDAKLENAYSEYATYAFADAVEALKQGYGIYRASDLADDYVVRLDRGELCLSVINDTKRVGPADGFEFSDVTATDWKIDMTRNLTKEEVAEVRANVVKR